MSPGSARVTLRQLCNLRLPASLLLPSLLPALRAVVPASHAGFFFCDEHGGITNLYAERMLPPSAMAAYHDQHSNLHFRNQYLARLAAARPVSRRSVSAAERASPYYRDVLGPLGIDHFLYAIVRHQGQPLGQLSLYRGPGEPPFSHADEQALEGVLHYLGEALAAPYPDAATEDHDHAAEEGLAVLDAQGQEQHADANWPRLLRLAHGRTIAPASALAERAALPRFMALVVAAARAAPDAVHRVRSRWGQFMFRHHVLHGNDGSTLIALRVARLAPEPLQLTQGAAALGLAPQQREVAVLMAQGLTNALIAERLGISVNTASYHVKKVFTRLGVRDRTGISKVLSAAARRPG